MSNNEEKEQKTTRLSEQEAQALAVEWKEFQQSYRVVNGVSVQTPRKEVALFIPGGTWRERVNIVYLSPQTALNLLAWLEQEKPTLEQRAQEWRELSQFLDQQEQKPCI